MASDAMTDLACVAGALGNKYQWAQDRTGARVFSCAHLFAPIYFLAPATQAITDHFLLILFLFFLLSCRKRMGKQMPDITLQRLFLLWIFKI